MLRDTVNEITAGQPGHQGVEVLSIHFTRQQLVDALEVDVYKMAAEQYPGRDLGLIVYMGEHPDGEGALEVLIEDRGAKPYDRAAQR